MGTLIEGKDYYIEKGRWVFTAQFLKARGYCCSSGCRHCPYNPKKAGVNPPNQSLATSNPCMGLDDPLTPDTPPANGTQSATYL